jgi:GTP-binding protein
MKVVSATYLRSSVEKKDYPPGSMAEIAFAGRSNVGKSSAINVLLGRKNLVRTSKTPGHTRKLNFFLINGKIIFVDFPGYGYANVPNEVREKWAPMVDTYLKERKQLAGVISIIDVRHSPTALDINLVSYLRELKIPTVVVATKADKLANAQLLRAKQNLGAALGPDLPILLFSAHSGMGKNELWGEIRKLLHS